MSYEFCFAQFHGNIWYDARTTIFHRPAVPDGDERTGVPNGPLVARAGSERAPTDDRPREFGRPGSVGPGTRNDGRPLLDISRSPGWIRAVSRLLLVNQRWPPPESLLRPFRRLALPCGNDPDYGRWTLTAPGGRSVVPTQNEGGTGRHGRGSMPVGRGESR